MDHSISNGVTLKLNQEVVKIDKKDDYYIITTRNDSFKTKNIINCAGVYSTTIQSMIETPSVEIRPRKGEYYVIARGAFQYINHIIFPLPSEKGKGILATPISEREILIGPTSEFVDDFDDVSTTALSLQQITKEIKHTMDDVPMDRVMRSFAGLRATSSLHDFSIYESNENPGLYHFIGIESPGLASAPAIAKYFSTIANLNKQPRKKDYKEYQATTRITNIDIEERQALMKENHDYGQIVCRCEAISLQEIKDALHGNVAANSLKGIKKRVRPGSGKCQGGFCEPEIVKIIATENNISQLDVVYDQLGSNVLVALSKEEFINE
ncbi:MAG: NAD(P)/FAD-dependent oxidoreductase, partial [Bacilli bacterium]